MTGRMIPLSDLEPDPGETAHAARLFARRETLDAADRMMATYAEIHASVVVDALDEGNAPLAAAALRGLVAHIRAGRARRAELEATAGGDPALRSRVPGAAWAAWRRSTVTPGVEGDPSDAAAGGAE